MALVRGCNLRAMVEWYVTGPGTLHAGPLGRCNPSVVSMVVLEDSHYYQGRITPRPLARH